MKSTSYGIAQTLAKRIQYERCRLDPVCIEKGQERRQEILKHSKRNANGVIKISKLARKLHGNIF